MTRTDKQRIARPLARRGSIVKMGVAAAALVLLAAFSAAALASSALSIASKSNSALGEKVLTNAEGRTLYLLSPETTHHLLCKSSECLKFWPPLTVSSSKAKIKLGAGIHGKLATFKRSNGKWQVTINGHPLYFFSEDMGPGEVNGQNFESFGGTWHVLSVSGSPSSKTPSKSASNTSAPSMPAPSSSGGSGGYGY